MLDADEPRDVSSPAAAPQPNGVTAGKLVGPLVPADVDPRAELEPSSEPASAIEPERIASRFGRIRNGT